ncbi:MAG: ABC transporter permease, partial [Terriglobales bacterium]
LRRAPLATGLALLSLALGIGATTALFSLMNAIMLRSLPVSHPKQLVHVMMQLPTSQHLLSSFSNPIWEQVRDHQQAFSSTFAWSFTQVPMRSSGQQQQLLAVEASGRYFTTLQIAPEAGRVFGTEVDGGSCPQIAVLSDAFWQSHFARSPAALGATLALANRDFQIIGVTPPGFFGMDVGTQFGVVLPLCAQALISPMNMLKMRDAWWLQVAGRLKPGETMAQAEAQLQARMPAWLQASVPSWSGQPKLEQNFLGRRVRLQPLAGGVSYLRGNYQLPLEILLGVAGLVLLVACANLAGLMLAQSAARKDETATRLALGASRSRLIRQMLTESLTLAVAGAALGAVLAAWACRWLEGYWSTQALAIHLYLTPDARVLGFALAVTLVTALLFGLPAALRSTDAGLSARGRSVTGHTGHRMAAVQVAISIVLIAGAGLFLRSFVNLARVDLGFDPDHVVTVQLGMTSRHDSNPAVAAGQARDLEALRRLPGVDSIAESFIIPIAGMQWDDALATEGANLPDVYI